MTDEGSALTASDVATAASRLRVRLTNAGIESAAAEAAWLLEAATGLTRAEQVLERDRPLDDDERARLEAWLRRREAREPLQLVLGVAPFHGLELQVRPGVLVPRPETESLVERVLASLRYVAAPRVHDVGTGCGAIALAIAAARPDALVTASDVDATAVLVARANAAALGLPVTVWASDLLAAPDVAAAAAAAHVVVANPPYLPEGDRGRVPPEVAFDPPEALFAGADGLAIARALARQVAPLLRPGGMLWLELDPRNAQAFADELAAVAAWRETRVEADLNGRRRFVMARR
jgi:release factor glutamine methyltransferase